MFDKKGDIRFQMAISKSVWLKTGIDRGKDIMMMTKLKFVGLILLIASSPAYAFAADADLSKLSCDDLTVEMDISALSLQIANAEMNAPQTNNSGSSGSVALNAFNKQSAILSADQARRDQRKSLIRLASLKREFSSRSCGTKQPQQNSAPATVVSPVVAEWARTSTWFNKNPLLTQLAIDEMDRLTERYPGVDAGYFLPLIDVYIGSLPQR